MRKVLKFSPLQSHLIAICLGFLLCAWVQSRLAIEPPQCSPLKITEISL